MKTLIYGVIFMSISQTFSNPAHLLDIYNSNEECGSNKDFFQGCSEDCTSNVYCIGNHLIKVDCKLQTDGEKPYCNSANNLCQSEEVTCNNNPSAPNEFQCPAQDGFYPDPLNCTKYYQCKNKVPHSSYCQGSGYKFDPRVSGCKKLVKCVEFSLEKGECRKKEGKYVVHPLDKNIYVKCETYPILLRCPTDNIFDIKLQECRYNCKKKGTFPDNDNEEYFYICEKVGLHWRPRHEKCPDGMIYDRNFAGCILKQSSEESSPEEHSTDRPSPEVPTTHESCTDESSCGQSSTDEPSPEEPSTNEPSTDEPSPEVPSTNEPSPQEPSTNEPSTDEPSPEEPSTNEPSPEEPSTNEPSPEEPSTNEPSTD